MKITLLETLKRLGKSQYWLAKETGISTSAISNLCNGKTTRIDFDVLQKICEALNCHVSDIIATDDENTTYDNILRGPQNDLIAFMAQNFDQIDSADIDNALLSDETKRSDLKELMDKYYKAVRECAAIENKKNPIEL